MNLIDCCKSKPTRSSLRRWLFPGLCVFLAGALIWSQQNASGAPSGEWREALAPWLEHIPLWAYLLSFLVLPTLGFPITAFYFTIGAFVDGLAPALLVAWCCMAGNMALSYAVARSFSRSARQLAERSGYPIPLVQGRNEWKVILTLRAAPLPWLMQNYLLALAGVRFGPYMLLGVPIQALVVVGLIVLGESMFAGNSQLVLPGLVLTLGIFFFLSWKGRLSSAR
jgi:uncharacterized membrane protein YdjX (TVP38/TMEM64 family)